MNKGIVIFLTFILLSSTFTTGRFGGYIEEFTYYLPEQFESVSPWDMLTYSDRQAISAMYSGLFIHLADSEQNRYLRVLASEDAKFSSNGTIIQVTLKKGLKFSNGENLTSEDVVFTYHTALSPAINKNSYEYYSKYFKGNESIYSSGDTVVHFKLTQPFVNAYDLLTIYIVSKNYYSAYFDQGHYNTSYFEDELTVTSGVYTLSDMDLEAQSLDLIKNEYYWNLENVETNLIYMKYITKSKFLSSKPEYSLLDPLFKLNTSEFTFDGRGREFLFYLSMITLAYNFNHPMIGAGNPEMNPEDTVNIRKAINQLLDQRFPKTDTSYRLYDSYTLFYSYEAINTDFELSYRGGLSKAIEFMELARFNFDDLGEPDPDGNYNQFFFNVTVSSSPDPLIQQITEYYSNQFSKIGIGVSAINTLNLSEYDNLINTDKHKLIYDKGGYDLLFTTLDWDLIANPFGLFNEGISKNGFVNYFNYYNSSYETIIHDYNKAITEESKIDNLRLIFQHIADNNVVSPILSLGLYAPHNWVFPDYFDIRLFTYQSFDWADISDDYVAPATYIRIDDEWGYSPYFWLLVIPIAFGLYFFFAVIYFFYNKMRKSRNKL